MDKTQSFFFLHAKSNFSVATFYSRHKTSGSFLVARFHHLSSFISGLTTLMSSSCLHISLYYASFISFAVIEHLNQKQLSERIYLTYNYWLKSFISRKSGQELEATSYITNKCMHGECSACSYTFQIPLCREWWCPQWAVFPSQLT